MIVHTNYISFILFFLFFLVLFYLLFIFIFHFVFYFLYILLLFYHFYFHFLFYFYSICFLCFPYFRGISLNSRADLEFQEFRLFPTIIFQKKIEIFNVSFLVLMGFSFSTMIFFLIIVGKSRNSLNSRSALEFKEFPRK